MYCHVADFYVPTSCTIATNTAASVSASCCQRIIAAAPRDGHCATSCHIDARAVAGRHFVIISFYMDGGAGIALYIDGIAARYAYLRIFQVDVRIAARHPYGMAGRATEVVGAVVVDFIVAIGEVDGLRTLPVCRNRDGVQRPGLRGHGGGQVTVHGINNEPLYLHIGSHTGFPAGAYALALHRKHLNIANKAIIQSRYFSLLDETNHGNPLDRYVSHIGCSLGHHAHLGQLVLELQGHRGVVACVVCRGP